MDVSKGLERIGFGGSCHWCTEAVFQSIRGVELVEQGWISPAGKQQFSEAVLVHFDPSLISLEVLVAVHLHSHSSTSEHSMRGKYRSAVYVFSEAQADQVMKAMVGLRKEFGEPIITEILRFGEFNLNSKEFLDYYATDPQRPFCKNYIEPKLKLLMERFGKEVVAGINKKGNKSLALQETMEENIMEPFEITVTLEGSVETLRVEPESEEREKHEYKIYQDEEFIGTVWPDCLDHGVCWFSSDEIAEDTLLKIGDAIEKYES